MKYLTIENPNNLFYVDIETNGLDHTLIHCVVIKCKGTKQVWKFYGEDKPLLYHELRKFFIERPQAIWCAHYGLSFDAGALAHYCGFLFEPDRWVDTVVLSYLYSPALEGGHSLEAYGERFKYPKIVHTDWSKFSPEMLHRCEVDVELLERVHDALLLKMNKIGFSEKSCWIEHQIRVVMDRQERNGFYLDEEKAWRLYNHLRFKEAELSKSIQSLFPPELVQVGDYQKRFKKNGEHTKAYEEHIGNAELLIKDKEDANGYETYSYRPFNIGSSDQRLERLLQLGYEPTAKTKKGNPKIDEDSLLEYAELSGRPEIKAMAEWLVVTGRARMIKGNPDKKPPTYGWLDFYNPETKRVYGKVLTCGAQSRRFRHMKPNMANVPSPQNGAAYGEECRSCWGVPPGLGHVLVGYDATGLEAHVLCHFLGNKEANRLLLEGDVHSSNQTALQSALDGFLGQGWGTVVRGGGGAKTALYACVPMSTKALTRRGWKLPGELIIGEEVLGYNPETKLKEWTTLRAINYLEDEVIKLSNSYRSFEATRNHRWFVHQRGTGKRPLKQHYLVDEIRTTDELTTESSIILNAPFNLSHDTISSVKGLDGKYDVDWISKVLSMSHNERMQFVQGFLLADGHVDKDNGNWHWVQNQGNIAEGLLLASYLVHDGQIHVIERYDMPHPMWAVTLASKGHITCQRLSKESLGIQPVWCPTTDLGSWVMRQGNEITITGNCLYGAYPPKLGSIVKQGKEAGEIIQKVLYKNVPGLGKAMADAQEEWDSRNGLIRCLDGGFVRCPNRSAALNYRVQPNGSVLMKLTAILLDKKLKEKGIWHMGVVNVHDEGQHETREGSAEQVGNTAVKCIEEAGEELNFKVRMEGQFKVGQSWASTH